MKFGHIAPVLALAVATSPALAERGGDGDLRVLYWQAPTVLNPYISTGAKDVDPASMVIEPLALVADDGSLIPVLAAEIPSLENGGIAQDYMSVTWKLKPGLIWSDGTPVTAEDVKFTAAYCMHPEFGCSVLSEFAGIASVEALDAQQTFMQHLTALGKLNRAVEYLPDDARMAEMKLQGAALTRPELAVLTAYSKLELFDEIVGSSAPDDAFFERLLVHYFPAPLAKFEEDMKGHRLRRDIIATVLSVVMLCDASIIQKLKKDSHPHFSNMQEMGLLYILRHLPSHRQWYFSAAYLPLARRLNAGISLLAFLLLYLDLRFYQGG